MSVKTAQIRRLCSRICSAASQLPGTARGNDEATAVAEQLHRMQLATSDLLDTYAETRPDIIHALAHRLAVTRPDPSRT